MFSIPCCSGLFPLLRIFLCWWESGWILWIYPDPASGGRGSQAEEPASPGEREVTLLDIYQLVAQETGIDPQKGADLEFSLECELCWANPYMLEVFHLLAAQGKTLAALSDMYLTKELLTRLLSLKGYEDFDQVMVSCDYNCSKRDGGLFDLLKERYPGRRIVHVGDNRISDIEKAGEKGLDTRFYQNVNEAGNVFRAKDMSRLAGSAYRGIVNAKLHSGYQQYSPYYEVGFVYTGIYVMGFCQWICRYVRNTKSKRFCFWHGKGTFIRKSFTPCIRISLQNMSSGPGSEW